MSTHILDHIVHLTPPGSIDAVSAHYRALGFHVTPGGTHADGLTYNALVALSDGTYIELIAFVAPSPPSMHRWGLAAPGWIDYSHLALLPDVARLINERSAEDSSDVVYAAGMPGGRDTPAGKTLQWRVTFPDAKMGLATGTLPFFCEDITPREWRVPTPTIHANTARGIAHIKLAARSVAEFDKLRAQLTTVLGVQSFTHTVSSTTMTSATWRINTPTPLRGLQSTLILDLIPDLAAHTPSPGIVEVAFWVDPGRGGREDATYGKIVWSPIPGDTGTVQR